MILVMIPILIMGGVMAVNVTAELGGSPPVLAIAAFFALCGFLLVTILRMTYQMDQESEEEVADESSMTPPQTARQADGHSESPAPPMAA